jgi:hypothetical protein
MQLIDVTLAFALTMAALATIVTIIMEAWLRIARMRKKNLIGVMQLLNKEIERGMPWMTPEERWDFFVKVVENPAEAVDALPKPEMTNETIKKHLGKAADATSKLELKNKIIEKHLSVFGNGKKWKGLYEKVSLEYMLRCLAESKSVKDAAMKGSKRLRTELNRIARKYEEFGSAVSISFKRHAQFWSMGIGVVLAIVANIDGLRIFEAYRADPNLAAAVVENRENLIKQNQKVQDSIQKLATLYTKEEAIKKKLEKAKKEEAANIEQLRREKTNIETEITRQSEITAIQKPIQEANQLLTDLVKTGIPMGWNYYPNCPYGKTDKEWLTSDPKCKASREGNGNEVIASITMDLPILNTAQNDPLGFLDWIFKVILTGILIGLGAPFWFDVAKRLAQVRKGLHNASASSEYRFSARDANGDANRRKEIVADVISDTAKEAALAAAEKASKMV